MKIYPYMNGSKSAKALAEAIGCKVLLRESPKKIKGCVLNWGASKIHREYDEVINHPGAVGQAANKLVSFELFRDGNVPTVEWTTENAKMMYWLAAGESVVFRHKLTGHSGEGIEIVSKETHKMNEIPNAPLYTKYTKKKEEYRIHVFNGEVIFQQRKARKKEVPDEEVNWKVRNLAGGFIFANDGVVAPEVCQQAAINAVKALGLDFGAADIGWHKDSGAVVYEVNTACGLQGSTIEAYANAIKRHVQMD